MRPDLVGPGNGREFAHAVLDHCRQTRHEEHLRAVVPSWNERIIRLAASMGFAPTGTHECVQGGRTVAYAALAALCRRAARPARLSEAHAAGSVL